MHSLLMISYVISFLLINVTIVTKAKEHSLSMMMMIRKAEEMPVPDWGMMGMTLTAGRLIGLGNITREDLPAALDER